MQIIKKVIRYPFNLMGLQIININGYNAQQQRISEIILTANKFYKETLQNSRDNLSDPEYLQFLELKYGGLVQNVSRNNVSPHDPRSKRQLQEGGMQGGDRMNVFFHNYSEKYSQYLEPLRHSKKTIHLLEVGILKGTGLAVWDWYFDNKRIYGFDYDLGNFEQNKNNLLELGAFKNELPTLKFFDQFADNSKTLDETFGSQKIDVVIDDAYHSDETIINTFNELQPYLSNNFVYFIEDNRSAWKKLQIKYPQYNFDYNDNELTVVTKK